MTPFPRGAEGSAAGCSGVTVLAGGKGAVVASRPAGGLSSGSGGENGSRCTPAARSESDYGKRKFSLSGMDVPTPVGQWAMGQSSKLCCFLPGVGGVGRDLLLWGVGSAAEGKRGACSPRIPAWRADVRKSCRALLCRGASS